MKKRQGVKCKTKSRRTVKSGSESDLFTLAAYHDLKRPLAAIGLSNELIGLLLKQPLTEKTIEDLNQLQDTIERSVARAEALINDIMSLVKICGDPSAVSVVNVLDVVESVIDENAATIEERGIVVQTDEDLGNLTARPSHVYQVFSNIIANAITHNDNANPFIRISYLGIDEKGGCRYLVRDNGSGISREHLDRIFDQFFKADGKCGAGIGLSIVAKITGLYSGWVEAYNANGVCFEFSMKGPKVGEAAEKRSIKTKWLRTFGLGACSSSSGHMRNRAFQDTVNHD